MGEAPPRSSAPHSGGQGTGRGAMTRERILDAASVLFYENGIHEISGDRIIEVVGVSKVTFYRHFRTKEDLVVAFLEQRSLIEREAFEGAYVQTGNDAMATLDLLAVGIGAESCRPGFRGCPFINAAAEYADRDSPVRLVIDRHRAWMLSFFRRLLSELDVARLDDATDAAMVLRDGAMVSGYLTDARAVAGTLTTMFHALVAAYRQRSGE
ncbi:TetR/AcrR family transcriptional regulator [Kineococcus sp. GCM10028916]|uniref:TetR/AcrR family transcriptional regulator n=1 Tax=Kineococcus sp. GCM10028916 TaxID=3273394 RepID=UPI00362E0977